MNKGELVAAVAKDSTLSLSDSEKVVNSVLNVIKKNAKKGVQLIGVERTEVDESGRRGQRQPDCGNQTILDQGRKCVARQNG